MSTERSIGTFDLPMANGVTWHGVMHLTRHPGGRRIKVVADDGYLMFDSLDCYDLATAMNAMSRWMERVHRLVESQSCPCAHCQAKRVEAAVRIGYCEHCGGTENAECVVCGRNRGTNVLIAG